VTIEQRTDARGRESYRAVVRVKDADGSWTVERGSWTRSHEKAEREERRLLSRRDADALAASHGTTLAAYMTDDWFPGVLATSKRGRPLARTTASKYRGHLDHVARHIGDVRLKDLRVAHVKRLRAELTASGTLAPSTVGDIMRTLSQVLRAAAAEGLVARNYADASLVNRPVGRPRRQPTITVEHGRAILAAVRGHQTFDLAAHLALGLSMRREEVLGLCWSDIDLDAGVIHVRQALTYADERLHVGEPKTEAGERDLPILPFIGAALDRHLSAQLDRRVLLADGWPTSHDVDVEPGFTAHHDLVIDRGAGGPWLPPTFSVYWRRFAMKAGLDVGSFHNLRHGTATLLLAAGVPGEIVIEIMGHRDTRILRRYQDVLPSLTRDAIERLEALLAP
jgi:integrase